MKRKSSLMLMEQLVMVLTFALAASLCLGIFAGAHKLSREARVLDDAVILAQSAAEVLKNTCGDEAQARNLAEHPYRLEIRKTHPVPGLGQAEIQVFAEAQPVFSLTTAWQEVDVP